VTVLAINYVPDVKTAPVQFEDASRALSGLGELFELWKTEGSVIFVKHAIQRYCNRLFAHLYFFEFDLAQASRLEASAQGVQDGITMRVCQGERELNRLVEAFAQTGIAPAAVEQRVRRGDIAMVAMAGSELAGYMWATSKERWLSEIRATIVPREDEIVVYDTRVIPRQRGKNLHYALSIALMPCLAKFGYRRALSGVAALNTRSLKTQRRLGKRKIADIISLPALGILRVRNTSATDGITIERRAPR